MKINEIKKERKFNNEMAINEKRNGENNHLISIIMK